MIKKILVLCFFTLTVFSQENILRGTVLGENSESLIGSSVYWINTQIGTTTDENGFFSISKEVLKINEL